MGLVDLLTRGTQRTPKVAAVTSGASVPSTDVLSVETAGQDLARKYSREIGLIADANNTAAMLAAACGLWVEYLQPDGRTWLPATEGTDRDHAAEAALDTYRDPAGSQSRLIYREYVLRERIGEAWRIQVPRANQPDRHCWQIVDPIAVTRTNRDTFTVLRTRAGGSASQGTAWRLARDRVQRTWRPDHSFDLEATGPMWGILRECRQLVDGDRATGKRFNSRVVGGTILHFPAVAMAEEIPNPRPGGPKAVLEERLQNWANSNAAAINDNTVGSVAPFITWYGGKEDPPPTAVPLGETLDPRWPAYRKDLLEAIAQGLPYPTRLILQGPGAGGNHWGDWLADDKATEQISSELREICEGITVGIFRPALRRLAEVGLFLGDPDRVRVGFDPAPLTQEPDQSKLLVDLLRLGIVGPDTVVRKVGLSDADLATDEERERILEFVGKQRVEVPGVATTTAPDTQPDHTRQAAAAPPPQPEPDRERVTLQPLPPPPDIKVVHVAAATGPDRWARFSDAMTAEDDRFRTGIAAVVATAMRDALRRAGVKVATKANRKAASVKDAVQAAAATGVYPPELLAVVEVDTRRLFDNAFDGASETAERLLAEHQERRRKLTADQLGVTVDVLRDEWAPVEADRRRALAAWLPIVLTGVAVDRLTRGVDVSRGEQPVDPTVPGDVVAAVVRISNGAQVRDGQVDTPTSAGTATGAGLVDQLVVDAVRTEGVLPLYEWRHGEPAVPFPPHVELDGAVWDDTQADAVLTNRDPFPPFDRFFPGDHAGCVCSIRVVWREGMAGDFTPEDIIDGGTR